MLPPVPVRALYGALERPFDVVLSVGTTSVFPYIAAPVVQQVHAGRVAVEINPGTSEVSGVVTWRLRDGAAAALDALWARLGSP